MVRSDTQGSQWLTGQVKPTPEELARARAAIEPDLGARYRLRDYVGRGAFATVWHAHDVASQENVAVKRFNAQGDKPRGFYRELSVLFRLRHPAIVRIINLLEAFNGTRYLILEYCSGGSLRAALSRARRAGATCPPARAAALAQRLAEALLVAHEQGIVHRDVKPENILFEWEDDGPFGGASPVKLADFGLAKLFQRKPSLDALARLSGSPAYMAPEQFQGDFGPASDLYALGVVLYELLTGRLPFEGSAEQLAYQHLRAEPPAAALPEPWPRWLAALLAKDPAARPSLAGWTDELRRLEPQKRTTKMSELSKEVVEALDRDLDRLQPTLLALGALRRGQKPRLAGPSLLERNGFSEGVAHPSMDAAIDWEDDEAEPAAAAAPTPFPGLTGSHRVYVPTAGVEQLVEFSSGKDEALPARDPWCGPTATVRTPPASEGKSVDEVLGWFDWR